MVFSQESLIKRADRSFEAFSYVEAIEQYERAFEKGYEDIEATRRLAECYRNIRDLSNAEIWYANVVVSPESKPLDMYRYAEALRAIGRYDAADLWMQKYAQSVTDDSRVARQSGAATKIPYLLIDPFLDGELSMLSCNSEYADLGPVVRGDKVVFASSRSPVITTKRRYAWDDSPFLDLFQGNITTGGDLDSIVPFADDEYNTKYHESNATFSADGNEMYFTRNNYFKGKARRSEDGVNNLKIFKAVKLNGVWQKEEEFQYNNNEFSVGHPCLSPDGKRLYFTSSQPGGFGGTDIYYCQRNENGDWDTPQNLGPRINTEGNEMFPFFFGRNSLFFSSDGHLGLGGLDLYLATMVGQRFVTVQNLGSPVNGKFDDISLVLMPDAASGFFTSNRPGGSGEDDLYRFELRDHFKPKIIFRAHATDPETLLPLSGLPIRLTTPDGQVLATGVTNDLGDVVFTVDPENEFIVHAGVEDGPRFVLPIDEDMMDITDHIELDIELPAIFDLEVMAHVTDAKTGLDLRDVEFVMTDILNGGMTVIHGQTDSIGQIRSMIPGKSWTDMVGYEIFLKRPGYFPKSISVDAMISELSEKSMRERMTFSMEPVEMGAELSAAIDMKPIYFDYDMDNIRPDAAKELDRVVFIMQTYPKIKIELGSHTDSRASNGYNQALSQRRAKSSREYLIAKGIEPSRIVARGFGESKLVNECGDGVDCTEKDHQLNRRTEFLVIGL